MEVAKGQYGVKNLVKKQGSRAEKIKQDVPKPADIQENELEIKVYPRTYIEEVTGVDAERKTATAKFVLFITIEVPDFLAPEEQVPNSNPSEQNQKKMKQEPRSATEEQKQKQKKEKQQREKKKRQLRQYISGHLILQFGYNQMIFVPQHKVCQNNPYLIKHIHNDNIQFSTYSICGNIQCSATFNNFLFPFRKIEVFNHLCFMSQVYKNTILKYKVMTLDPEDLNEDHQPHKYRQFLPYFGNTQFGDYVIDQKSTLVNVGYDVKQIKNQMHPSRFLENIRGVSQYSLHLVKKQSKKQLEDNAGGNAQQNQNISRHVIGSHKHILFKFDMISLQYSFVLQNQVPIWILSFVTLMLYEAQPSIGGKYSNIILLLVSYISIISNFRINNIEQMGYSFFEYKVLVLILAPLLLIISTSIDYYADKNFKDIGEIQLITNPFGITSLVLVFLSFVGTCGLIFYVWFQKFWKGCDFFCFGKKTDRKTQQQKQELLDWMNMIDLDWVESDIYERR